MMTLRKSEERGFADHGWLKSRHTFSFADYQDPNHVHFRKLRVINEDWINPAEGFGTHPHEDMEIITYVLSGALEHKDSMGNSSVILPGEVQRMSAGTGVTHSEFNHSKEDVTHLLQIWIFPREKGLKPSYEQKKFSDELKTNKLCLVASKNGREGSVTIHQDVDLYASILEKEEDISFNIQKDRYLWIQVIKGSLNVNGHSLNSGDAASLSDELSLKLQAPEKAEFLVFDLA